MPCSTSHPLPHKKLQVIIEYKDKKHSSATIKNGAIILRISKNLSVQDQQKHINQLIARLKPKLTTKLKDQIWQNGEYLSAYGYKHFWLDLQETDKNKLLIEIDKTLPFIKIQKPKTLDQKEFQQKLIHKISKLLEPELISYIRNLNQQTVARELKQISFKKLESRWGYCNYQAKTIVLSTKLFKTSKACFDYVIIHELCHLIEPNHKPAFWKLVEHHCPNYKQAQKELLNYQ